MKGLYVTAKVGERNKRFIEDSYQSDTIPLERDSILLHLIMPYLELTSDEPAEDDYGPDTVKIELPLGNKKVYNHSGQMVYVCNTLWRNRLSEEGQAKVKRFFDHEVKKAFRTYMDGYIESQNATETGRQYKRIKEGITAFFIQYHIDFTKQDIAAFARDWYRHRDKVDENLRSPLVK